MRQGNRCYWCKEFMTVTQHGRDPLPTDATLDHLVPISDGGSKKAKNVVAACAKCNNERPSQKHLRDVAREQAEAQSRREQKDEAA